MLRTSGALVAGGAVLAACGTTPTVTRIGETPTIPKLTEATVSDAALLRTAMSVEKMVANMLSDSRLTGLADKTSAPIIAAFAAAHNAHLTALAPMVTAHGGQPYNEPNEKLMVAYGEPALALIAEGKKAVDVLALTLALETLVAGTYQYFVALATEPALRAEMMRFGAKSSRRAAVASQLIDGGIKAFGQQFDDQGILIPGTIATFPAAFGSLSSVQVSLGAENEVGTRATILMDTPSLNSIIY